MSQTSPIAGGGTAPSIEPAPTLGSGGFAAPATAAQPTQSAAAGQSSSQTQPTPDQRLLIQETGQMGVYVYTVIDRTSGTVIVQIPHMQVEKLANLDNYESGQVISTQA